MMICAAKPKRAGRKKKNPMNSSILLITQAQVVANAGSSTYEVHARVQVHRASARAFQGGPKRRLHPIKVEVLTNHAQEQQMEETCAAGSAYLEPNQELATAPASPVSSTRNLPGFNRPLGLKRLMPSSTTSPDQRESPSR